MRSVNWSVVLIFILLFSILDSSIGISPQNPSTNDDLTGFCESDYTWYRNGEENWDFAYVLEIDVNYDGYLLRYDSFPEKCSEGELTRYDESDWIEFGGSRLDHGYPGTNARRGFVEWDVSELEGKKIIGVELIHEGNRRDSDAKITKLVNQPSVTSDLDLWEDVGSDILDDFEIKYGIHTYLNYRDYGVGEEVNLVEAIQIAVDSNQDWFAIGFLSPSECPEELPTSDIGSFWSQDSSHRTMKLIVRYITPGEISIVDSSSTSLGDEWIFECGGESEKFIIESKFQAQITLQTEKDIYEIDEKVKLTSLPEEENVLTEIINSIFDVLRNLLGLTPATAQAAGGHEIEKGEMLVTLPFYVYGSGYTSDNLKCVYGETGRYCLLSCDNYFDDGWQAVDDFCKCQGYAGAAPDPACNGVIGQTNIRKWDTSFCPVETEGGIITGSRFMISVLCVEAATCEDECTLGSQCLGTALQECSDCDGDDCLEWCTTQDCSEQNAWYDSGDVYTCVNEGQICDCQVEEYRSYTCSGGCDYTVTTTQISYSNCESACGNGVVDQGEVCDGGIESQECGIDIGECEKGIQERTCSDCSWGQWGECVDEVGSSEEICDGKDNNCDGSIDEGCSCLFSESRDCLLSQGVCSNTKETCTNGEWPGCVYPGTYEESEESCDDNLDNDCDGSVDKLDEDCIVDCSSLIQVECLEDCNWCDECLGSKTSIEGCFEECSYSCEKGKCGGECSINSDCDDSDADTNDFCSEDCRCNYNSKALCGNQEINSGEECDGSGCGEICKGKLTRLSTGCDNCFCSYGETVCITGECGAECCVDSDCSDGDVNTKDICSSFTCENTKDEKCGNSVIDSGEQCEASIASELWDCSAVECSGNLVKERISCQGCSCEYSEADCRVGECGAQCCIDQDCNDGDTSTKDICSSYSCEYLQATPSTLTNLGEELKGLLTIKVQKRIDEEWIDIQVVAQQEVFLPEGEILDLSQVWNTAGGYITKEAGLFQVQAHITDANGRVLSIADGTYLSYGYEFRVE